MKINVEAYSEAFHAQSKVLNETFRQQVWERYERELNSVELAQTRTTGIQLAATLFVVGEMDIGTQPEDVLKAYSIACSVGLQNIAEQYGVSVPDCVTMFGQYFVAAVGFGRAGGGVEAEIDPTPFGQQ